MSGLRRWGGPGERVVVVLLHGVMDRASSFGRLGRRLAERPGVAAVAYDRRGYDTSIATGPGDLDDHAADLAEVVGGLDAARVVVLGHSYGGTVAWHAVAGGLRPWLVATYESPVPSLPAYRDDVAAATLRVADADGPAAAVEHFGRTMLGAGNWGRLRPAFREQRLAEGPAVVADLRSLGAFGHVAAPAEVRRLVGYGTAGPAYEALVAGQLGDLLGVRPSGIDGAGHGVHLTHPDACSRWILEAVGPV